MAAKKTETKIKDLLKLAKNSRLSFNGIEFALSGDLEDTPDAISKFKKTEAETYDEVLTTSDKDPAKWLIQIEEKSFLITGSAESYKQIKKIFKKSRG